MQAPIFKVQNDPRGPGCGGCRILNLRFSLASTTMGRKSISKKRAKQRRKRPLPAIPQKRKKQGIIATRLFTNSYAGLFCQKKVLSNPADFPIFIVNCTAWCRGKQDLPRGALGAKQETLTKNKQNNIGGTR